MTASASTLSPAATAQRTEVHITDVLAYKSCRLRWSWSSRLRGNLEPNRPYAPFMLGTIVHKAMEELVSEGVAPLYSVAAATRTQTRKMKEATGGLLRAERDLIREQYDLARGMMDHYLAWTKTNTGPFADDNLDFLAHEQVFEVPLRTPRFNPSTRVYLAGKFDGLVRKKDDGTLWLWEVKTCRGINERLKLLPHDEQASAYCLAAQELYGEPVAGILYTLLRKKVPTAPKELVKGGLSQDKRIDTTREAYLQAIRDYHGQEATPAFVMTKYGEMLDYLKNEAQPFFARVGISRTQTQLNLFAQELHAVALEMVRPGTPIYAHGHWGCSSCWFKDPCLRRALGDTAGVEMLLRLNYRQRQLEEDDDDE